jgi:Ca2+-binding RTX toxin-like protein
MVDTSDNIQLIGPAAKATMSVWDWSKYATAILNRGNLAEENMSLAAWQDYVTPEAESNYSGGWGAYWMDSDGTPTNLWHQGAVQGWRSQISVNFQDEFYVIGMSNEGFVPAHQDLIDYLEENFTQKLEVDYVFDVAAAIKSDPIIYSAVDIPDWLSFDSKTGILTGTPGVTNIGSHMVILKAADLAGASTTETIVLEVGNDKKIEIIESYERFEGTAIDDRLWGSNNKDVLVGLAGDDILSAGAGDDEVFGGLGDDIIIGGSGLGDDTYRGEGGTDTLKYTSALAGVKVDLLNGFASSIDPNDPALIWNDILFGIENVTAGDFDDIIIGSTENNILIGGSGKDTIQAGAGEDTLVGEAGNDTIHLSSSDVFVGRSIARNTTTDDRISVEGMTRFSSVIDGGEDADAIYLTDGSNGDAFFLHDSYSGLHESVTVLEDGFGRKTVARVISIETINAGDGDDIIDLTSPTFDMAGVRVTLNGEEGNDILWAAEGDDTLNAGAGDDVLFGDKGNDNFTGGAGADIFEFTSSETSQIDTIQDYTSEDQLKFYLKQNQSELTDSNIVNGDLVWGNVTIDFAGVEVASLGDLNLVYDFI